MNSENRVSMVPAGIEELTKRGHRVLVESGAGLGSGIGDEEYRKAGAEVIDGHGRVFEEADMVVKVKEPLPEEYPFLKRGQILITYLHLAPEPELTQRLVDDGVIAVAYETIQLPNGSLPCLTPMSEVAGRMTVQVGAHYLQKANGGRGVLLGGVPGVPPVDVVIVGAGTVGAEAAKMAMGLGAQVTLIDVNLDRLRYLESNLHGRLITVMSNRFNVARAVRYADLLIGAVLVPGARAPHIVTEDMVQTMKPGSVIIDVAVDQGGCIQTIDRTTTHANPTYVKHGVVHYAVPNMPGAVPRTATYALSNATLPYVVKLADLGYKEAALSDPALAKGFNVCRGAVVHERIARAHGMAYTPLEDAL